MGTGYRAIFRMESDVDATRVAETEMRDWLASKARTRDQRTAVSEWSGAGQYDLSPTQALTVTSADDPRSGDRRRLYRLTEKSVSRTWIVSVHATTRQRPNKSSQTLVVEVDLANVDQEQALKKADPPRLAKHILENYRVVDGATRLRSGPHLARYDDLDEVLGAITDQERTASVVVASSFSQDMDAAWHAIIQSLTRQSVGVSAVYVLTAEAVDALNVRLPHTHRIDKGRVRTFSPLVDLSSPDDAIRHRVLGPTTLERSIQQRKVVEPLPSIHAARARRRFVELQLPTDVRRSLDLLKIAESREQRASRAVREAVLPTTPSTLDDVVDTTVLLGRIEAMAVQWTTLASPLTLRHLDELELSLRRKTSETRLAEEQLDEAAKVEEELRVELQASKRELEDTQIELAALSESSRRDSLDAIILRQRIAKSSRPEDAFVEPLGEQWHDPESISELVSRITLGKDAHFVFERIQFTGDVSTAQEVESRDPFGRYASAFWDHVHVLWDYSAARIKGEFSGNVHQYLSSDAASGHKCTPKQHAGTESETVVSNPRWRNERTLPVPLNVDSSGRALMLAHFKPSFENTFAPRMHYLDDLEGSGHIYIGYIGRHLTNKSS